MAALGLENRGGGFGMMAEVKGHRLICPVCRGIDFRERRALLNSRGMTFLGLDWLNDGAITYICEACGYIFWFVDDGEAYLEKQEKEIGIGRENPVIDYETSKPEKDECPICFNKKYEDEKECRNCGHIF